MPTQSMRSTEIDYPDPPSLPDPPELSGWFRRLLAQLVDDLVVLIPIMITIGIAGALGAQDDDPATGVQIAGGALTALGVIGAWAIIFLTMDRSGERNGQTPGKQLLGIRVVKRNRDSVDMDLAAGRELGCKTLLLGLLPFGVASGVAEFSAIAGGILFAGAAVLLLYNYLRPLWNADNMALHDKLSDTQVVRAR